MRTTARRLGLRVFALVAAAACIGTVLVRAASGDDAGPARAADSQPEIRPLAAAARFSTVFPAPVGVEGLTGDSHGNLYTAGRGGDTGCPVWRVPAAGGPAVVVGTIAAPCGPAGLAFDARGRLYIGNGASVVTLTPDAANPPTATVFTDAVAGANGLAFDRRGNLWVSDGGTGQGRVWRIGPDGQPQIVFRVQPMLNEVNLVNGVGGVGRDPRGLPPGQVTVTPNGRTAADTAGSQHIVANGLAFNADGSVLYVADTARGAIWQVNLDRRGNLRSPTGCDATFSPDTLCLDDVFVAHPLLDGADGIALDRAGNIWTAANERNAVVVVTPQRRVVEVFRSPADPATRLRNTGPMEFPTSPFLTGRTLCVTQSDGSRRDNAPNTGGEATPTGAVRAKVNCLDSRLPAAGLPVPIG
ncbi:MAG TPA: SMP-30/gluconolactonase/LRE family protein [Mycobacteriales bacterium]|nr:SMP-30/gluconolactonase/LRE family protein [Mycobacteriales bacterium]